MVLDDDKVATLKTVLSKAQSSLETGDNVGAVIAIINARQVLGESK
jgi:predicted transcriptional regulator